MLQLKELDSPLPPRVVACARWRPTLCRPTTAARRARHAHRVGRRLSLEEQATIKRLTFRDAKDRFHIGYEKWKAIREAKGFLAFLSLYNATPGDHVRKLVELGVIKLDAERSPPTPLRRRAMSPSRKALARSPLCKGP